MSAKQRKSVVASLTPTFKKKAKTYENAIYSMCQAVSEEYGDEVTDTYSKYAFEKVGHLLANPDDTSSIIDDIEGCTLTWNSFVYADFREKEDRDTTDQAAGMKVEKGEFKCRNVWCRSDECFYYQDQTRSADEGATTYVVCTKCGNRYAFN